MALSAIPGACLSECHLNNFTSAGVPFCWGVAAGVALRWSRTVFKQLKVRVPLKVVTRKADFLRNRFPQQTTWCDNLLECVALYLQRLVWVRAGPEEAMGGLSVANSLVRGCWLPFFKP